MFGWMQYFGKAMSIAGILAQANNPHSVDDYLKLTSQIALAIEPKLQNDATFQMVQTSLANIDAATAAQGPGEVGKPVAFKNQGQQLYLHFTVDTK